MASAAEPQLGAASSHIANSMTPRQDAHGHSTPLVIQPLPTEALTPGSTKHREKAYTIDVSNKNGYLCHTTVEARWEGITSADIFALYVYPGETLCAAWHHFMLGKMQCRPCLDVGPEHSALSEKHVTSSARPHHSGARAVRHHTSLHAPLPAIS